jgi:uncharacterized LabA/DUF88 family protein
MQLLPSPLSQSYPGTDPRRSAHVDRVTIFIDAASLFYAANHLGIEIDYTKLLKVLTKGRPLIRAYFYTGVDPTNKKQQNFLFWMRHHGYRVVTKELIQHPDGTRKANLQIEMAVDMLKLANHCDTLILLSGHGELSYAVRKASDYGVQIEVVSLPSMLNDGLRDVADHFTDLTKLQTAIQKSIPQAG